MWVAERVSVEKKACWGSQWEGVKNMKTRRGKGGGGGVIEKEIAQCTTYRPVCVVDPGAAM